MYYSCMRWFLVVKTINGKNLRVLVRDDYLFQAFLALNEVHRTRPSEFRLVSLGCTY